MKNLKRVVYDVDDTLWNLNKTICEIYGIDFEKCISYHIDENTKLTEQEKITFLNAYRNPYIFARCKFYEGCERIFDLEKNGLAEVWISSANLNKSVKEIKEKRLANEIPNINMEHVKLTFANEIYQGRVNGYILIDDSILNIEKEDFPYNILIDMPYNRDEETIKKNCGDKNIIRVYSLNEAITIAENIIKDEKDENK